MVSVAELPPSRADLEPLQGRKHVSPVERPHPADGWQPASE